MINSDLFRFHLHVTEKAKHMHTQETLQCACDEFENVLRTFSVVDLQVDVFCTKKKYISAPAYI